MWDLSCRDWEARLRDGRPLMPELRLFREEADMAVRIFNALRLPDVPGLPMMRDAAGDWFRDIVAAVFGSVDPQTRERWIREFFVLVGKGNSKTTNAAGLMLVAMLMIPRPRAEYLFVGPTQAISDLAFAQAVGMIEADPALKKRFHIRDHVKEIVDRVRKSKLKVKTFDLTILTGPRPVGVLIDELHLLGKHPATAKVLAQIRGGMEKSPEAFLIIITTQSDEPPAGAFREELNYARGIRDGRIQGRTLPVLYEFPDAIARSPAEWQRADYWPMVMPNLGRSLQLPSLLQAWQKAKDTSATDMQVWASQHLNIEVGLGLKSDRWRGADHWEAAAEPGLTLDAIVDRCEVVAIGIDGGGEDDMLGLAVIGREVGTRRWLHWARAWVTTKAIERRKSEESRFRDFERAGDMAIVESITEANDEAAALVLEVWETGLLCNVGVDMHGPTGALNSMAALGLPVGKEEGALTIGVSQGWTLSGAIKDVEVMLSERTMCHAGQSVMAYSVSNAKVEPRGNAISITKQLAGAGKIDPLIATFVAAAIMRRNPEAMGGASVYDQLGADQEAHSDAHQAREHAIDPQDDDEEEDVFA
jgi:phage terminase large subunit-like protein